MKHTFRILSLALLVVALAFVFVACGETPAPTPEPDNGGENGGTTPDPIPDPSLKTIEGITFVGATYDYDGAEKELLISGELPEGVTVSYTGNKGTNAGTYKAVATMSGEGYNTLVLRADLVINKLNYDLSQVAWDYITPFTYTGSEFGVSISGLPEGITLNSYTGAKATNAGTYTAVANISYDTVNHNAPVIPTCSWKINKADIVGITFEGATVEYDTYSHSIAIVGNVPSGVTLEYICNGQSYTVFNAIEVGTYEVTAKLTSPNHNTLTLTATLKINSTEEQLYLAVLNDGTILFQNNLDGNKLYTYKDGTLTRLSSDVGQYLASTGSSIYYIASSLLGDAIKEYNGSSVSKLYTTQAVKENAEYLTTDGKNLYFAINNTLLNTDLNGIYKYALDGSMAAPVRICTAKAAYLVYYENKIYFSNLSEDDALYSVSTTATNSAGTMLWDEKVEYIILDNDTLYFNSTAGLLKGSAIRKYEIPTGNCIKLTTDAGKYLTKVGSYIYYINDDVATGFLFGNNICKVSALLTSDSILPGTKVISAEDDGFSSLSSDGENLYYYRLNDKHLYCYNVDDKTEVDLMAGFVPPVDPTTLTGYSKIAEYNGEIYYTNPLEGGVVLKYNPATKLLVKVIDDSVSGIYFHDGYMYFSTYNVIGNYTLWKMDLLTNIPVSISSSRCDHLMFTDNYIYYVKVGVSGSYSNHLMRMDYNGENVTEVFADKNMYIADVQMYGNDIFFIINPLIGKKYIHKYNTVTESVTNLEIIALTFTVSGNTIYYYDNDESLKSCDLNGNSVKTLVEDVEVNDLIVLNGKLYFSSISSSKKGTYVYDLTSKSLTNIGSFNADAMTVIDGTLYYIQTAVTYFGDGPSHESGNDGHLYYLNGLTPVKLV